MKITIAILVIIIIAVSFWFWSDHQTLLGKLDDETTAFKNMQAQSAQQAIDAIKLQTCVATAEGIYQRTGKYYSVIDCVNSQTTSTQ